MSKIKAMLKGIVTFATNKRYRTIWLCKCGFYNRLPDDVYITKLYYAKMDKHINLQNPITFNEKLQWLKLHDRNPKYTQMVDKFEAKKYVSNFIGEEYIIPTYGVWDKFDDIDFGQLPNQFVLKCTHDSGGLVICRDKSKLDIKKARKKINISLKQDYYLWGREWPYKDVKPRIIAEKYIENSDGNIRDYKIFCFNGEPHIIMTVCGGHTNEKLTVRRMYDIYWNLLPVGLQGKEAVTDKEPQPKQLNNMIEIARILSANKEFLRVDLYDINDHIYFGELTFYHQSGFECFVPEKYDEVFGSYIRL